jgi:hypothetical protein
MPAGGGSFAKGRIVVIDSTPTGDFFLDRALADFIATKRPPRARGWINGRRPTLPGSTWARQAAQNAAMSAQISMG